MSMNFLPAAGLPLLALFLLACDPDEAAPGPAGPGAGSVQVRAFGLGEADVDYVQVELLPTLGSSGVPDTFDLLRQGGSFSQRVDAIPAGEYTAVASAYKNGVVDAIFISDETGAFTVPAGGSVGVDIFLYQDQDGDDDQVPYFLSVTYDRQPMVGEAVAFTVQAGGGEGDLTLTAASQGVGSWSAMSGDPRLGTGLITWTIPPEQSPTDVTVTLTITDEDGSKANLVMEMSVEPETGNLLVDVDFNLAPTALVDVEVENEAASTEVTLTFTFEDPELDGIDYNLDFSDCVAATFDVTPTPTGGILEGTVASGAVLVVQLSADDGDPRSCTVEIELVDDHASSPASSSQSVEIQSGWVVEP